MRKPTSFLLVVKAGHGEAAAAAANMLGWFAARALDARVIQADAGPDALCAAALCADAVIVLGGDGTVVGVCRKLACGCGVLPPYFGVNFGQVGFLAEAPKDAWEPWFESLISGRLAARPRTMLGWTVYRGADIRAEGFAINDVVVGRGSLARVLPVRVVIEEGAESGTAWHAAEPGQEPGQELECALGQRHDLGWVRSDGILISTPQGTSAYALSAHGPLLHPDIAALTLTPISPFYKSFAPMVLPPDRRIRLESAPESDSEVFLTVDGQEGFALEGEDIVLVRGIEGRFRQLTPFADTYFQRLRERGFIQTAGDAFPSPASPLSGIPADRKQRRLP